MNQFIPHGREFFPWDIGKTISESDRDCFGRLSSYLQRSDYGIDCFLVFRKRTQTHSGDKLLSAYNRVQNISHVILVKTL